MLSSQKANRLRTGRFKEKKGGSCLVVAYGEVGKKLYSVASWLGRTS